VCPLCAQITNRIPWNVYRVVCKNCLTEHDFAEFILGRERREELDAKALGVCWFVCLINTCGWGLSHAFPIMRQWSAWH
jgi:hypothetical protein